MSYTLIFHQLALEEIQDAHDWYEQQRTGLGLEFMDAIDEVVQRILSIPKSHPVVYQQRRKALPARFPYLIIFELHGDVIVVVAIIHASRNPQRWQER
ncbi:MAG: type II toxin-antitoxin system RelE/ParE family toxin [Saprospiraceae bacterium]|nr:type II toxin-antitoxin system RelE/ParE family toxin [Saprospiraceae bacterium]